MNNISAFLLLIALFIPATAAELNIVSPSEVYRFAGSQSEVMVTIQNSGKEQVSSPISYRIFQASAATLVPLGVKKTIGEKQFEPVGAATLMLPFDAPEIRAITRFIVKLSAGEQDLGSVQMTVVPPRLFSQFAKELEGSVDLYEPQPLLAPVLRESGVHLSNGSENLNPQLSIVSLPNKAAEEAWREHRVSSKQRLPTLFIVGSGVTGFEKLLPIKAQVRGGDRLEVMQEWFIPELKTDALSQLRLLRVLQLLARPEQERDPAKIMNLE